MSGDPSLPDDDMADVMAAELALGLLDGEERAVALRRVLEDRAFAAEVEQWREQFAQLFMLWPEATAPADTMDRVERSLAPTAPAAVARSWGWPLATTVASVAAAILLFVVVTRPVPLAVVPPVVSAPQQVLAASLQPTGKGSPVVAVYEPASGTIRIEGMAADADHTAQLWVIAGKAPPRPLGLLAAEAKRIVVADATRPTLTRGVTLAISIEPAGGSPTGLPTGPVVASGKLAAV